jgi:TrpR-related protein YerC/YecD
MCTSKEILAIAQRYTVAKMLKERRVYSEIVNETGASTATVSRVKRVLMDGTGAISDLIERDKE